MYQPVRTKPTLKSPIKGKQLGLNAKFRFDCTSEEYLFKEEPPQGILALRITRKKPIYIYNGHVATSSRGELLEVTSDLLPTAALRVFAS